MPILVHVVGAEMSQAIAILNQQVRSMKEVRMQFNYKANKATMLSDEKVLCRHVVHSD